MRKRRPSRASFALVFLLGRTLSIELSTPYLRYRQYLDTLAPLLKREFRLYYKLLGFMLY